MVYASVVLQPIIAALVCNAPPSKPTLCVEDKGDANLGADVLASLRARVPQRIRVLRCSADNTGATWKIVIRGTGPDPVMVDFSGRHAAWSTELSRVHGDRASGVQAFTLKVAELLRGSLRRLLATVGDVEQPPDRVDAAITALDEEPSTETAPPRAAASPPTLPSIAVVLDTGIVVDPDGKLYAGLRGQLAVLRPFGRSLSAGLVAGARVLPAAKRESVVISGDYVSVGATLKWDFGDWAVYGVVLGRYERFRITPAVGLVDQGRPRTWVFGGAFGASAVVARLGQVTLGPSLRIHAWANPKRILLNNRRIFFQSWAEAEIGLFAAAHFGEAVPNP